MVKGIASHVYGYVVCSVVLPPKTVRVSRRDDRPNEFVSIRGDGTAFVLWNSVTVFDTHARVGCSSIGIDLGRVRYKNLVLG